MVEITSPDYPGERDRGRKALAAERTRKREELLAATEAELARIAASVKRQRSPLLGADKIGLKVGAVLGKEMAKHFELTVTDTSFNSHPQRALDPKGSGPRRLLTVPRTGVPAETLGAAAVVSTYKSLAQVERAFRSLKTVRPRRPPGPPPSRRTGARPRLPVHARLLRGLAYAGTPGAVAVRRSR